MLSQEIIQKFSKELKIDKERIAREFYEIIILNEMARQKWSQQLIFKGGTALRLAYGSPRFSDDLAFSMIEAVQPELLFRFAQQFSKKFGAKVRDQWEKRETILVEFSIEEQILPQAFGLKIEISKRPSRNLRFQLKLLRSDVSPLEALFNVQTLESIFSDKLSAINSRNEPRDLFDIWFVSQKLNKPFRVKISLDPKILKQALNKYLPANWHRVIDEIYRVAQENQ